jgi:hypothetical protein
MLHFCQGYAGPGLLAGVSIERNEYVLCVSYKKKLILRGHLRVARHRASESHHL